MRIILASKSPRRKELLEQIGTKFEIIPAIGEEIIKYKEPSLAVEDLSYQKAIEILKGQYPTIAKNLKNLHVKIDPHCIKFPLENMDDIEPFLILGSDTVVAYRTQILGKPKDEANAFQMIKLLQGKEHEVFTGVTLIYLKDSCISIETFHTRTGVSVYPMSDEEIANYIKTKEPFDKAGSYAIQGKFAPYIEKIQGDYNTVVGLPVAEIYQHLIKVEIDILKNS